MKQCFAMWPNGQTLLIKQIPNVCLTIARLAMELDAQQNDKILVFRPWQNDQTLFVRHPTFASRDNVSQNIVRQTFCDKQ